jgi:hypothetical protein
VSTELHLDPELAAVVEQARRRAADSGEWPRRPRRAFQSDMPTEAANVIAEWLRDGGYDEAIAQITAEDPDLATSSAPDMTVVIDDRLLLDGLAGRAPQSIADELTRGEASRQAPGTTDSAAPYSAGRAPPPSPADWNVSTSPLAIMSAPRSKVYQKTSGSSTPAWSSPSCSPSGSAGTSTC